jgi:hypothetical protein
MALPAIDFLIADGDLELDGKKVVPSSRNVPGTVPVDENGNVVPSSLSLQRGTVFGNRLAGRRRARDPQSVSRVRPPHSARRPLRATSEAVCPTRPPLPQDARTDPRRLHRLRHLRPTVYQPRRPAGARPPDPTRVRRHPRPRESPGVPPLMQWEKRRRRAVGARGVVVKTKHTADTRPSFGEKNSRAIRNRPSKSKPAAWSGLVPQCGFVSEKTRGSLAGSPFVFPFESEEAAPRRRSISARRCSRSRSGLRPASSARSSSVVAPIAQSGGTDGSPVAWNGCTGAKASA